MNYALIGAQICVLRKSLHMTQAELAERANLSVSFTGHIERGTRIPSLATMVAIAQALGVTVDTLLPPPSPTDTPAGSEAASLSQARRLLSLALTMAEGMQ